MPPCPFLPGRQRHAHRSRREHSRPGPHASRHRHDHRSHARLAANRRGLHRPRKVRRNHRGCPPEQGVAHLLSVATFQERPGSTRRAHHHHHGRHSARRRKSYRAHRARHSAGQLHHDGLRAGERRTLGCRRHDEQGGTLLRREPDAHHTQHGHRRADSGRHFWNGGRAPASHRPSHPAYR